MPFKSVIPPTACKTLPLENGTLSYTLMKRLCVTPQRLGAIRAREQGNFCKFHEDVLDRNYTIVKNCTEDIRSTVKHDGRHG